MLAPFERARAYSAGILHKIMQFPFQEKIWRNVYRTLLALFLHQNPLINLGFKHIQRNTTVKQDRVMEVPN